MLHATKGIDDAELLSVTTQDSEEIATAFTVS